MITLPGLSLGQQDYSVYKSKCVPQLSNLHLSFNSTHIWYYPWWFAGLVAKLLSDSCDPMDQSPRDSSVHGILQARILEWVAIWYYYKYNIKGAAVVSNSVRPHRRQPTRLPCPWDSPGKNTRVGCHFLLQCVKVKSESEVVQSCLTLRDPMDHSLPGSSIHGIFQARVLEWVAIAFSNTHTTTCKIDNQQGPTVQHMELYSIFCNNIWEKSLKKSECMYM